MFLTEFYQCILQIVLYFVFTIKIEKLRKKIIKLNYGKILLFYLSKTK